MKTIAIVLLAACMATTAWGYEIALEFVAGDGIDCQMTIPCNCRGRLNVSAVVGPEGITGAEYRITVGLNSNPDPGWLFVETFNPGALVLGTGSLNPPDNQTRGVNLVWPSCQTPVDGRVLLETVDVYNLGCSTAELRLRVEKRDQPSNQFFQCPLLVLCDDPTFTKVCAGFVTTCQNPEPPFPNNAMCSTSGQAWINPGPTRFCCLSCPPLQADCTIDVERPSWSGVKSLYRN